MRFAYFGYRGWAEDILKDVRKDGDFIIDSFTIPKTEYANPVDTQSTVLTRKQINALPFENYGAALFYGWSWMIPQEIVDNNNCVCLHPSPLPRYRGGTPLQHQIMNGEQTSAVTLFRMDKGVDTGPIYAQQQFPLDGSMKDILGRISQSGADLTTRLLKQFENGTAHATPQDETQATFFNRRPAEYELTPQMMQTMTGEQMYNFVRALGDPYPNAYIVGSDGQRVYLKESDFRND